MPRRREAETAPPYTGPLVIIRPAQPSGYQVMIEPRLPTGEGQPRHFQCKLGAWAAAQGLWTRHRLGCRDEADGHVGRHYRDEASER